MATGKIKNWAEFQHYKDRSPPWIKLHRGFLDDFDFARLPLASKALAPLVWLLAAEQQDGTVCIDPEWLAFRLRWPVSDVAEGLKPLLDGGFIIADSAVLAECLQGACPEGEAEGETEAEGEKKSTPARKPKKAKAPELTLADWTLALGDDDAISPDDPIFDWAAKASIPREWVALAWWAFEGRYLESAKTYADWRAVFRKALREDWLKLWRRDQRTDAWTLTTAGDMAQREMSA